MTPAPPIRELQGCRNRGQKGQLSPPPDFGWNISHTLTFKKPCKTTCFRPFGFVDLPTSLGQGHIPTL